MSSTSSTQNTTNTTITNDESPSTTTSVSVEVNIPTTANSTDTITGNDGDAATNTQPANDETTTNGTITATTAEHFYWEDGLSDVPINVVVTHNIRWFSLQILTGMFLFVCIYIY